MKHWLETIVMICFCSMAQASPWSGRLGLDASSVGGLIVHDFRTESTVSGIEWDVEHILYANSEIAEAGLNGVYRDTDGHFLAGPSFGVPGTTVGALAADVSLFSNWPILKTIADYGQYIHAYFNIGYDLSRPNALKLRPDLYGLGGVLKFGI